MSQVVLIELQGEVFCAVSNGEFVWNLLIYGPGLWEVILCQHIAI